MTEQPPPAPLPPYNEDQLSAITKQLTTRRIVFDAAGEPFWMPPFQPGDSERPPKHSAGDRVSFYLNGVARTGTIDVLTPDGTLLWVWLDGGAGRRLLYSDDSTLTTLDPASADAS